jgi:hypothetical protein
MNYLYTSPILSTESILVSSDVIFQNPFFPPKQATINFDFSHPLIGTYESIDNDPNLRNKMVDYFYDLVRDKWLLDELNDILNYFKYTNGEVKMITNMSEYSSKNITKDTDDIAEKKVKFITKNLFDKYSMTDVLTKFTKGTNTKWVELPKNEYFIMKFVKEYLLKKLKKMI